jgi:hypothetical protein
MLIADDFWYGSKVFVEKKINVWNVYVICVKNVLCEKNFNFFLYKCTQRFLRIEKQINNNGKTKPNIVRTLSLEQ